MSIISLEQALSYGINELREAKINSARLDAEILLGFVLGFNREKVLLNYELRIKNYEWEKFKKLVKMRSKHWPIAYLTGSKEFYGIDFLINKNVLVPRPETELLVEEVLKYTTSPAMPRQIGGLLPSPINRRGTSPIPNRRKGEVKILEIGTGSGCIALTLAKYLPKTKITAVDISKKALVVACGNRRNLKTKNVKLLKSNLLEKVKNKPDIIVANLPYLNWKELKEASISKEPKLALYGGKDGLGIYKKLLQQIKIKFIDNHSQLAVFFEINPSQKNKIIKIIKNIFPSAKIEVKKDLAGRDRVVIVHLGSTQKHGANTNF